MLAGPTNGLTDVPGLRVGHATLRGDGSLTGCTVVLCPPEGAVAGVDVRGAAPGTRETDLLDPSRMVQRVHALLLSGGSAYGLAAADGVMQGLEWDGIGFPLGPGRVVPIVPAAVCFDLGRGGTFEARPDASTGLAAYRAGTETAAGAAVPSGVLGAGTGAVAGGLKGGIGTASAVLTDGGTVAALVVLNAAGTPVDPNTGELYGARYGLSGEFDALRRPAEGELAAARQAGVLRTALDGPLRATTLAVLGTDLTLTKAQCTLLAAMGADGLARAVRPVHTMLDGDLTFALSTAVRPEPELTALHELLATAADCVARAIVHAALTADSVTTRAGRWPSYRDTFPTALG
ncbi:MAG TPA: P1 family peptidase [Pseudonocardia sp.]